jgi:hypothetical protein
MKPLPPAFEISLAGPSLNDVPQACRELVAGLISSAAHPHPVFRDLLAPHQAQMAGRDSHPLEIADFHGIHVFRDISFAYLAMPEKLKERESKPWGTRLNGSFSALGRSLILAEQKRHQQ